MSATQTKSSLHPKIIDALEEVFGRFGALERTMAREEPEACIFSLLERAKKDLPHVSATVYNTVESASYQGNVKKAKEKLEE